MPLNTALILLALIAQVFLTFYVYFHMIRGRFAAVSGKQVSREQYVLVEGEPRTQARATRNLANQFELPVLFYAVVLMLVAVNRVTMFDVVIAWVFVVSRLAHHIVHVGRDDTALRTPVFAIGMTAVALIALHGLIIVVGEAFL